MGAFNLSWHWFAAVASVPAWMGVLLTVLYLPESPRFLYVNKDYQGTSEVIAYIARQCRTTTSLSTSGRELQDDEAAVAGETTGIAERLTFLGGDRGPPNDRDGWKERLLRWWNGEGAEGRDHLLALFHPALLRTTLTTIGVWWTISFGRFHLSPFSPLFPCSLILLPLFYPPLPLSFSLLFSPSLS